MKQQEGILETKSCLHCLVAFDIMQEDRDFYDKISPTFAGEKFQIPNPSLCSDCRQRRRLSFRNERRLYKRKCSASGKDVISIYSPDKPYTVFDQKIWWSDERDPMDYGRDFDFSRLFTEQFGELMRVVPRMALNVLNNEGSEFISFAGNNKNCYLIYTADRNEGCMYGSYALENKDCVDFCHTNNSQLCYEVYHVNNSYLCQHSCYLENCSSLWYCVDMEGCSDCFLSNGWKNKQYIFKNEELSKEGYHKLVQKYLEQHNRYELLAHWREMLNNISVKTVKNSENCDGTNVINSKFCFSCSNIKQSEYLRYCTFASDMRNSMDRDFYGDNGERCYECVNHANDCYHDICAMNCWGSSSCLYYCDLCQYCSHCFGCIGLRNKQYCIFNKQYTKEDYEILVGKIIRHMMQPRRDALLARPGESYTERGEFFHPSLSPFGYNETVAQEYYPLSVDPVGTRQALSDAQQNKTVLFDSKLSNTNDDGRGKSTSLQIDYSTFGYHRSTYVAPTPQVDKVIKGSELDAYDPVGTDIIRSQTDDILKMAVLCEVSNKPFRITPQELAFYRKHHIPLPRKHPDVRHEERMKLRM